MQFTPNMNDGHSVFVFGSNLAGVHGAGAAAEAVHYWGAVRGVGEGRTGESYALPTKDKQIQTLPLLDIQAAVARFLLYAESRPHLRFLVTKVGCGLAGCSEADIQPMFEAAKAMPNVVLPDDWR